MDILIPWFDFATSSDAHTGAEWCKHIYRVLEELQVPQRLYEWSLEAERDGDLESRPVTSKCTMRSLDSSMK